MEEKLIYKQMIEIMKKTTSISKDRKNQNQGYNFRGIDDVYNELHSVMADCGVFMVTKVIADRHEERTTKSGGLAIYRVLTIEFSFIASDGSSVTSCVIGEGMDSGDKASNKAMSVAQKYALIQAFLIPTEEEKDPENYDHDLKPDSIRVGANVNALMSILKSKEIPFDFFTGFLINHKEIKVGQDIRHLGETRAKSYIDNWPMAESMLKKYGDK